MAIIVKNTFLDVAEHKFLHFDEPCVSDRRCHSLPRKWKPVMPSSRDDNTLSPSSLDSSTRASLPSEFSFFSPCASSDELSISAQVEAQPTFSVASQCQSRTSSTVPRVNVSDLCASSSEGTSDCNDWESDVATGPSMHFWCNTPTSSMGSPRELVGRCFCQGSGNELETVLCYLTSCHCELDGGEAGVASGMVSDVTGNVKNVTSTSSNTKGTSHEESLTMSSELQRENEHQEPESEPEVYAQAEFAAGAHGTRTKLKSEAPAFQPVPSDTTMDAIANAVYLALVSCGRAHQVKVEKGLKGTSSTLISAEVQSGPRASSRSYDVVHLAKQALDAIAAQLHSATLLSARVQKEECGYCLRSSIACVPDGAEDRICWDMFRTGSCPRRQQCRWHHPQDSDIGRIKVSVRYAEEARNVLSEEQLGFTSSAERRKISLGELV